VRQGFAVSPVSEHEKEGSRHRLVSVARDCTGARWQDAGGERARQGDDVPREPAAQGRKMTKPTLLIVDDDEDIRTQMRWALAVDYEVVTADDRAAAITQFTAARPSVALLDLGLPPRPNDCEEGLATLASLLAIDSLAKVIVVSGQSEKENAL